MVAWWKRIWRNRGVSHGEAFVWSHVVSRCCQFLLEEDHWFLWGRDRSGDSGDSKTQHVGKWYDEVPMRVPMSVGQLRELLARGGFRLTKWYGNAREVLATIPESERAKPVVILDLEKLPTETALGLKWNTEENKFVWRSQRRSCNFLIDDPWRVEEWI